MRQFYLYYKHLKFKKGEFYLSFLLKITMTWMKSFLGDDGRPMGIFYVVLSCFVCLLKILNNGMFCLNMKRIEK